MCDRAQVCCCTAAATRSVSLVGGRREGGREGGREGAREGGREGGRKGGREAGRQGGREAGREEGREGGREGGGEGACGIEALVFKSGCCVHDHVALNCWNSSLRLCVQAWF